MAWPAEGQHTLDFFTKIPGASGQGANSSLVSIGTFSWESIRRLRKNPKSSSFVMTATVVVVVATHNLALGVLVGVLLSALFFAAKISKVLHVGSSLADEGLIRQYTVVGQVFFTSADRFIASFDLKEAVEKVSSTSAAPTSGTSPPSAPSTRSSSDFAGKGPKWKSSV